MRRSLDPLRSPVLHLRAGFVLPVSGPPIPDGAVRVCRGVIMAVAPASRLVPQPGDEVLSFPDGILLPGMVNAHCHLELGDRAGRVPYPGTLPGWLRALTALPPADAAQVAHNVRAGARTLLAGGATCVGDITTTGFARAPLRRTGLRAVSFRELLGFTPERVAAARAAAQEWLTETTAGVTNGISPHAPYSTAAALFQEAARLALASGVPFTTHLSESLDEAEFVARGEGEFLELLRARGIPPEVWQPRGSSPIRYLADLGVLEVPGAAAHVNYLLPGDLELLAAGKLVPVYCPRSHAFFRHPPHPAGEMLRAGIPVALGTDSLASNHGLDMLAEARLAWQSVAGTGAADWVRAATLNGARALGQDDLCGTLEPGKRADLIVVRPGGHAPDPYAAVLSPGSTVQFTLVDGRVP